jgi:hypothetical protein
MTETGIYTVEHIRREIQKRLAPKGAKKMNTVAGVPLKHFKASEFRHPNMMDSQFLLFLDAVREQAGLPFILTSDGRSYDHNLRVGGASRSLHLFTAGRGARAVDFGTSWGRRPWVEFAAITEAVIEVSKAIDQHYQLELVWSAKDKHIHLGLLREGPSQLIIAAD